jgi:NADH:ubiquinone oxidoreductase subunit 3 (subunit A)
MRPAYLKPIPTRRPWACVVHDWAVRLVLALLLLVALGYAWYAGKMLWQVLR